VKQLWLVRHAKSSWSDSTLSDFNRPLNGRGERDAPRMGRRLAARPSRPDVLIASPAARAKRTAEIIAGAIGYDADTIVWDRRIYDASPSDLLQLIRATAKEAESAMVLGHNPAMTIVANALGGCAIDNVPTCGIVHLAFDVSDWKDVGDGVGRLVDFDYPKRRPGEAQLGAPGDLFGTDRECRPASNSYRPLARR
jgi:phosphohistidine phosphatase